MTQEAPWYVSLTIAWLPFILFLVAFHWFVGRPLKQGLFTKDGRSIADVIAEFSKEMKRHEAVRFEQSKHRPDDV